MGSVDILQFVQLSPCRRGAGRLVGRIVNSSLAMQRPSLGLLQRSKASAAHHEPRCGKTRRAGGVTRARPQSGLVPSIPLRGCLRLRRLLMPISPSSAQPRRGTSRSEGTDGQR
jgi:hypothetical protein